jgi:hypothetical protein
MPINDLELTKGKPLVTNDNKENISETFNQRSLFEKIIIYASIFFCVFGGAVIGVVSNELPTKKLGIYLNLCWRFIPMVFFLIMITVISEIKKLQS